MIARLLTLPMATALTVAVGWGCATRPARVAAPEPPAAAAPPRAEPAPDGAVAALRELRDELQELLGQVQRELEAELREASPTTAASGAGQRNVSAGAAPQPGEGVAGETAHGEPTAPERIDELRERRLIIAIALARISRALERRRIELGLAAGAAEEPDAVGLSGLAGVGGEEVEPLLLDPATASLGEVLLAAELALDRARRLRAEGRGKDRTAGKAPGTPWPGTDGDDYDVPPGDGRGPAGLPGVIGGIDQPLQDREVGLEFAERKREDAPPPLPPLEGEGAEAGADGWAKGKGAAEPAASGKPSPKTSGAGAGFYRGGEGRRDQSSRRAAVVVHGAPPAGVMSAVQRSLAALADCIPEASREQGPLRFRVTARLGADGRLHEPVVRSGGALAPTAAACLADELRRVRAPAPPDGASRVVSFPLWLSSD